MEKRLMVFLGSLFLCFGMAIAQTQVKGTIISADDGEPLPGASVKVVGEKLGTTTNLDGEFTITVPNEDARLEISHIGMLRRVVKARTGMRIALDADNSELDEVMVVAYGTQKKSSFTGAASTIKADKIEKMQVSSLSKGLEGQVAGVQINSSSGTPGSDATILVRGIGSISSGKQPLIVLDGVPYEGSLNSIPSQDIESLTVLKDAAANSMYGARGANGVIMITTKGSKGGKAKVNFDGRWGFNARAVGNYDIIKDPGEYYEMAFEAYRNSRVSQMGYVGASQYTADNLINILRYNIYQGVADNNIIDPLTGRLTPAAEAASRKWSDDWTKDPFKNGLRQEYNVNVSGGTDQTQVYFSAGYLGDEGYMAGSDFDRFSGRVKVDQKVGDHIKLGGNVAYVRTDMSTFGAESTNYSNIFAWSQDIAPIYPVYLYENDGTPVLDNNGKQKYDFGREHLRPYSSEANPLAVAKENINRSIVDNVTSRGYVEVNFLKDFKFTANVAYDVFNSNATEFTTPIGGDAVSVGGRGEKTSTRTAALNVNQILDWNHEFGNHGVHVMLAHENKKNWNSLLWAYGSHFQDWNNPELINAALLEDGTSYTSEYALEGFLAKGEYNYLDRYYLTASVRRDGSSRFGKDNRWGTFWAVGGAWRINEEPFFKNVRKTVNNLKLKASYGTQGNDAVGYAHTDRDYYTISRVGGGEAGFTKAFRGNKDLTWEKQSMFNVGLEAGFWQRLNIGFDFFIKSNKDMLFQSPLAASEGSPTYIWRNEVDMKNTGFEVELNGDVIKTSDIRWNVGLNFSHYKNELTKLPASKPEDQYPDGFSRGDYWWKKGGSIYEWSGYEYVGVDPTNGKTQYNKYVDDYDSEGNKTGQHIEIVNSTSDNPTLKDLGKSAIPDLIGGISTSLEAYGFDLSIQTAFQIGGWVNDAHYASLMSSGNSQGHNYHRDAFQRWTPAHTDTDIPALNWGSNDAAISNYADFFLTKASYFNLKNITLGYTIPAKYTRKAYIERCRVYLSGENIWLASKRQGLDPRQSYTGSTGSVYSPLSAYSVGLNLTF